LRGVRLDADVDPIATYRAIQEAGVLTTLAGGDVLRLCPALTISVDEVEEGLAVVEKVLLDPPKKSS